jgi:pantetheine-phosphate adenylyltransferase
MRVAIYPGSFDPITNGHLDILKRAANIFDHVIILLAINPNKKTAFTPDERLEMIKGAVKDLGDKISVDVTEGLSVVYAKKHGAIAIVRGLRAVPDFEYEFQFASGNEFIDKSIEMVFFMSRRNSTFISSTTIKELFVQGVDISKLVPNNVGEYLQKLQKKNHS